MFEIFAMVGLLIVMIGLAFFALKLKKDSEVQIYAIDGDDDVKIAGGHFRDSNSGNRDSAEEAAKEFLMQKEAGNIEKAAMLGELLANKLWRIAGDLLMRDDSQISAKEAHQQIVIRSYAVNIFVADQSPSSLLAETVLSVFYNKIEELSKVFYKHVSDTAAFSLYILAHRSNGSDVEVGRIYAQLCGKENNTAKINEGNKIYNEFYAICEDIADSNIEYND